MQHRFKNCSPLFDHAGTLRDKLITIDADCGFQCFAAPPDRLELSAQHKGQWEAHVTRICTKVYALSTQSGVLA